MTQEQAPTDPQLPQLSPQVIAACKNLVRDALAQSGPRFAALTVDGRPATPEEIKLYRDGFAEGGLAGMLLALSLGANERANNAEGNGG